MLVHDDDSLTVATALLLILSGLDMLQSALRISLATQALQQSRASKLMLTKRWHFERLLTALKEASVSLDLATKLLRPAPALSGCSEKQWRIRCQKSDKLDSICDDIHHRLDIFLAYQARDIDALSPDVWDSIKGMAINLGSTRVILETVLDEVSKAYGISSL